MFQDSVVTDFQRLLQSVSTTISPPTSSHDSRPLSLADSFSGVRDSLDKPRLHLPSRTQQISNNIRQRSDSSRFIDDDSSSGSLSFKTKIITNPLLKKLFNKDRISVTNSHPVRVKSSKPKVIKKPALEILEQTVLDIRNDPSASASIELLKTRNELRKPAIEFLRNPATTTTTFKPKVATTTPLTTTTTTTATPSTAFSRLQPQLQQQPSLLDVIKNTISKDRSDATEEDLVNALIEKRVEEELARRKKIELERIEEERQRLLTARQGEETLASVVRAASDAIERRVVTESDKSSPAVWAAVRSLRNFVSSRSESTTSVPEKVIKAVTQLTRFLQSEDVITEEEEEISVRQIDSFMKKNNSSRSVEENEIKIQSTVPAIKRLEPSNNLRTFRFSTLPI